MSARTAHQDNLLDELARRADLVAAGCIAAVTAAALERWRPRTVRGPVR